MVLIERKHVNNRYVNTLKEFDGGEGKTGKTPGHIRGVGPASHQGQFSSTWMP